MPTPGRFRAEGKRRRGRSSGSESCCEAPDTYYLLPNPVEVLLNRTTGEGDSSSDGGARKHCSTRWSCARCWDPHFATAGVSQDLRCYQFANQAVTSRISVAFLQQRKQAARRKALTWCPPPSRSRTLAPRYWPPAAAWPVPTAWRPPLPTARPFCASSSGRRVATGMRYNETETGLLRHCRLRRPVPLEGNTAAMCVCYRQ